MSCEDYSNHIVQTVVAQICLAIGWNSITDSALEVLVDLTNRYIHNIGTRAQLYSGHGKL